MLQIAEANLGRSADSLQEELLARVHDFMAAAPPFDDITLMTVVRSPGDSDRSIADRQEPTA